MTPTHPHVGDYVEVHTLDYVARGWVARLKSRFQDIVRGGVKVGSIAVLEGVEVSTPLGQIVVEASAWNFDKFEHKWVSRSK